MSCFLLFLFLFIGYYRKTRDLQHHVGNFQKIEYLHAANSSGFNCLSNSSAVLITSASLSIFASSNSSLSSVFTKSCQTIRNWFGEIISYFERRTTNGVVEGINNKGYNKYVKLQGQVTITLDEEKYLADSKWDGLKGYLTNTTLAKEAVVEYYRQLWHVEKTFRISKTDLRIRPVYHFKRKRIEAHICIAFAACKVYKELERQLRNRKSDLSPEKAIEILKTIYGITIQLPQSKENKLMLLDKTKEQKALLNMFI